jgi:Transglycosylase SLT domain
MPSLDDLDPVFQAAGKEWNVDPLLLKAMAKQESGGNPRAVSKAGAQGLMQIMPDTAKGLGVTDPNDPVQSIWGAAKYMNRALDKEGSAEGALLNYHGGDGWRQAYGPESRGYVPAVAGHYKALLGAQQPQQPSGPQPPPAAAQGDQEPAAVVIGDSLASKGGLGGTGVVGASPQAVLNSINQGNKGGAYRGRDVVLSSGVSNDPAKAEHLTEQLSALDSGEARSVTVVGVGPAIEAKVPGINARLRQLAEDKGAHFVALPSGQFAGDGVHPTPGGYKQLRIWTGLS